MTWLTWVALGLLQGLTEFLPVSSSGHLVLAQRLLGIAVPGVLLEVTLHAATALAVVAFFARELWGMIVAVARWPLRDRPTFRGRGATREDCARRGLATNILVATVATAAIGFGFQPLFRGAFEEPRVAAGMLLVTGAVLFLSARIRRGRRGLADLRPDDAVWIGLVQGLAIFPGLSRSGLTITGGLGRKMTAAAAVRFSFLLSLAAIAGVTVVEVGESSGLRVALATAVPVGGLAAAALAAFVSGVLAMAALTGLVERGRLRWFAWYCWVVGGVSLIWLSAN